nr:MAG TPA: hypothetical protein [Caudoviricetes sp.]
MLWKPCTYWVFYVFYKVVMPFLSSSLFFFLGF